MVANPMQKMKRNSTLVGVIIGLVIALLAGAVLYILVLQPVMQTGVGLGSGNTTKQVAVLNKTIKSGTQITLADYTIKTVNSQNIPADAIGGITGDILVTAKIDLAVGTVLGNSMLNIGAKTITADMRDQEYGMIALPTQLSVGEFIDIRLQMPNGGDYIVISKKQVLKCDATNVTLNMCEEEINLMSNAVIEHYIMPGSKLYATVYNEAGSQAAAIGTYVPNSSVETLIKENPNIQNLISSERYSEEFKKQIRGSAINSALAPYYIDPDGDGKTEALDNIEENIEKEIEAIKEARENYFATLNAAQ